MNVITKKNLKTPRPSTEWIHRARMSLHGLVGSGSPLINLICDEASPQRHAVHCIWSIGLTTLVNLKGLEDWEPQPVCWRFVAGGHESMTAGAAGCLAIDAAQGVNPRVVAVSQGSEMSGLLRDAELLNTASELKEHEYELRVLRIPALYLEAFWLRCLGDHGDWVVPYGLILGGNNQEYVKLHGKAKLTKNKPYKASAFLSAVREVARRRLAAPDIAQSEAAVKAAQLRQRNPRARAVRHL